MGNRDALRKIQSAAVGYFLEHTDNDSGLVADSSRPGAPASIAATGLGLSVLLVACRAEILSKGDCSARVEKTLEFLLDAPQSDGADVSGHRGFFYHFLDRSSGRRAWQSELSTIDTAILMAGVLSTACFFDGASATEKRLRELAAAIYLRVEWAWMDRAARGMAHGWKPETGFLNYGWSGFSEAIILYALALGSPSHPAAPSSYRACAQTYRWENTDGRDLLYAGPLFIHYLSHAWIDFRGLQDDFMRLRKHDYFENARAAVEIQRAYAERNPKSFAGYGRDCWGLSACNGPGPTRRRIAGKLQAFYNYRARGAPYGPDDGTICPSATIACLPFEPEAVGSFLDQARSRFPAIVDQRGNFRTFNATFRSGDGFWISDAVFGVELGPVAIMIQNYFDDFLWKLMRSSTYLQNGLERAGFKR